MNEKPSHIVYFDGDAIAPFNVRAENLDDAVRLAKGLLAARVSEDETSHTREYLHGPWRLGPARALTGEAGKYLVIFKRPMTFPFEVFGASDAAEAEFIARDDFVGLADEISPNSYYADDWTDMAVRVVEKTD